MKALRGFFLDLQRFAGDGSEDAWGTITLSALAGVLREKECGTYYVYHENGEGGGPYLLAESEFAFSDGHGSPVGTVQVMEKGKQYQLSVGSDFYAEDGSEDFKAILQTGTAAEDGIWTIGTENEWPGFRVLGSGDQLLAESGSGRKQFVLNDASAEGSSKIAALKRGSWSGITDCGISVEAGDEVSVNGEFSISTPAGDAAVPAKANYATTGGKAGVTGLENAAVGIAETNGGISLEAGRGNETTTVTAVSGKTARFVVDSEGVVTLLGGTVRAEGTDVKVYDGTGGSYETVEEKTLGATYRKRITRTKASFNTVTKKITMEYGADDPGDGISLRTGIIRVESSFSPKPVVVGAETGEVTGGNGSSFSGGEVFCTLDTNDNNKVRYTLSADAGEIMVRQNGETYIYKALPEHSISVTLKEGGAFGDSPADLKELGGVSADPADIMEIIQGASDTNIVLKNPALTDSNVYIYTGPDVSDPLGKECATLTKTGSGYTLVGGHCTELFADFKELDPGKTVTVDAAKVEGDLYCRTKDTSSSTESNTVSFQLGDETSPTELTAGSIASSDSIKAGGHLIASVPYREGVTRAFFVDVSGRVTLRQGSAVKIDDITYKNPDGESDLYLAVEADGSVVLDAGASPVILNGTTYSAGTSVIVNDTAYTNSGTKPLVVGKDGSVTLTGGAFISLYGTTYTNMGTKPVVVGKDGSASLAAGASLAMEGFGAITGTGSKAVTVGADGTVRSGDGGPLAGGESFATVDLDGSGKELRRTAYTLSADGREIMVEQAGESKIYVYQAKEGEKISVTMKAGAGAFAAGQPGNISGCELSGVRTGSADIAEAVSIGSDGSLVLEPTATRTLYYHPSGGKCAALAPSGSTYTLTAESSAVRDIDLSHLGTATLKVNGAKLGASTKYIAKGGAFTTGDKDFTIAQNGTQTAISHAASVNLLTAGTYQFPTATAAAVAKAGTYTLNGRAYTATGAAGFSVRANGTAQLTAGEVSLAGGETIDIGTTTYTAAANGTRLAYSGGKAKLTAGTVALDKGETVAVGTTSYTSAANGTALSYAAKD
ncbi:MAG: hypothetical protein IKH16_04645, partial [Selenomonadaceae bacterium]|nr:hypothetical protein [Selenomonadaceae bacterium]